MKLVLIVEDEYGNAEVVQLLLETAGYRVATASNGKAAMELIGEEKPALILSDFMMPTMNGGELGEAVRRNAALTGIPFIFMSGTSEDVVRQSFRDYDAFLPKPFKVDTLLLLVARFIKDGRHSPPTSKEVGDSMRQLLKGLHLPPGA
jgi:two-component system phosphate regulon response regulator PhoB